MALGVVGCPERLGTPDLVIAEYRPCSLYHSVDRAPSNTEGRDLHVAAQGLWTDKPEADAQALAVWSEVLPVGDRATGRNHAITAAA